MSAARSPVPSLRPSPALVLGGLLLAVGLGLWLFVPDQPASYGWFAYAPVDSTFTPPQIMVPSAGRYWGIGLSALGAVLISGVIGYRIGRDERAEERLTTSSSGAAPGPVDSPADDQPGYGTPDPKP